MPSQRSTTREITSFAGRFESVTTNIARVIQGKDNAIRLTLVCLLAEGHLLIEDVPGVGKTSLAKALAASLDVTCHRIQFTPDLLPSDVTGVVVYNRANGSFEFRPGGIFANVVVGDEINRASPKTQSALLEAMEERQVTVDATTYRLSAPFMVIATQNPVEHEGTYPLPESQLDRFLMRIDMGYPDRPAEIAMLDAHGGENAVNDVLPVIGAAEVQAMVRLARQVHVAPALKGYIVDVAAATRRHPAVDVGVSPRASLAFQRAARSLAASVGREYVIPDDLKELADPVLGHRIVLRPEAQLNGVSATQVLDEVMSAVAVPTNRAVAT